MSDVDPSTEPWVHGVVGAQFGDLEFDVGKSVRWFEHFTDDTFIVDINTGDQRYWVVNWAESFPQAKHVVTGRNYFVTPVEWRREQFQAAAEAFNYQDDDWVLFIDAHEGLSVDNRSLPDDYASAPFKSFIYREIERATGDVVLLPFFVYLNHSDLQNVTYETNANSGGQDFGIPAVQQAISVPRYLPVDALPRLIRVSALRDTGFDWGSLDQPVELEDPDVKLQVISYGYAHWNLPDIPPGHTTIPALTADNDLGYRMRTMLSRVRPIAGIPFGTPWQGPETDPATLPGPWCIDTHSNVDPTLEETVEEHGHTPPDTATEGIRVPLYDTVVRLNLRDGLWYERGASGNVPLAWDSVNQQWKATYAPEEWPEKGVGSLLEEPPTPSKIALRLDGSSGTHTRTSDSANFFDPESLTIVAVVNLDDWHPGERKVIASKWYPADDECSWVWYVEPGGGMAFVISRDGSTPVEFNLDLSDGPGFDLPEETSVALAVSFATSALTLEDEVRFWLCPTFDMRTWEQAGPTLTQPNPDLTPLYDSVAQLQVGAHSGNVGNLAGYFYSVSFRRGVGERDNTPYVGGVEVGLLRGDLQSNPSYDRYGNLWSNQGTGWSYDEIPGVP